MKVVDGEINKLDWFDYMKNFIQGKPNNSI